MKRFYFLFCLLFLFCVSCSTISEKKVKQEIPKKKIEDLIKEEKDQPAKKTRGQKVEALQILQKGTGKIPSKSYIPGTLLLKTTWNQSFPYNKRLPKINRERVVAGCVNTALAQILYYYQYPASSSGIIKHYWRGRQFVSNLNKNYNWEIIPRKITATTPQYQIDELASLFYDLGVLNTTDFNLASNGGSGASFNKRILIEKMGFSTKLSQMKNNNPKFLKTIKREIDQRRPVLLSIKGIPSGHMAVIDAYKIKSGRVKFHINMGWGGADNNFYDLNKKIVPASKKDKNSLASDINFLPEMTIYYNLSPCGGIDCYRNLEPGDQIRDMAIKGSFKNSKDQDIYKGIFLKGLTTFKGNRGYSNQAFYVKIYDKQNRLLVSQAPKSKVFRVILKPDKYDIEVSLCNKKGSRESCYKANPAYLNYTVRIQSNSLSLAEREQINSMDDPPEITGKFPNMIQRKKFTEYKIRIDTYDPDSDPLRIKAFTDPADPNIELGLIGNILSIYPKNPISNSTSKITIQAMSKGKVITKSFRILFSATQVSFGKEFDVSGKFVGQAKRNRHKVILDGRCRIQGDNGYKNQAFYINLTDIKGNDRYQNPVDYTIWDEFNRGIYYIEPMLKYTKTIKKGNRTNKTTKSYNYKKGLNDIYNINISCPEFNNSLALLQQDNRDFPPTIKTRLPDLILPIRFRSIIIPIKTIDLNGDPIHLSVKTSSNKINASIKNNKLKLTQNRAKTGNSVKTTLTANANGRNTQKSFNTFFYKNGVKFGKRFELTGKIQGQREVQSHTVILAGHCSIKGNNGYRNQAFYTSVDKLDKSTLVNPVDKKITGFFPLALYKLKASLQNGKGRFYKYRNGKGDIYKITVQCSDGNISSNEIARILQN